MAGHTLPPHTPNPIGGIVMPKDHIIKAVKSLIQRLPDDCEDYADMSQYRWIQDGITQVERALNEYEHPEGHVITISENVITMRVDTPVQEALNWINEDYLISEQKTHGPYHTEDVLSVSYLNYLHAIELRMRDGSTWTCPFEECSLYITDPRLLSLSPSKDTQK